MAARPGRNPRQARPKAFTANPEELFGSSGYLRQVAETKIKALFFILNYLKTNNLQTVQGALVGISQPKANVWIHCLHPVLNQALADLGELPVRQMEKMTFAADEETIYFHDGTERPIPRPCDPQQQQLAYSGKKNDMVSKIMS